MELEALDFLVARLSWPVPVVRWRAARALRDLVEGPQTRSDTTRMLLCNLAGARCETEECAVLTVFLMARPDARPASQVLRTTLRHPSILAALLFQHLYGENDLQWEQAHSGPVPDYFVPEVFFEAQRTAHVPPILSNNLRKLERRTGLPFLRQWAFEWQTLQEASGLSRTEYPYYFDSYAEVRRGIIGQYIQGQGELYRSAYLRTLALAVDRWRMPEELAKGYAMDTVPAVPGTFEIDPGTRPGWLGDIPERCAARPDDLERLARKLVDATRDLELRPVSFSIPIDAAVARHGIFSMSAYLVTDDLPAGAIPECRIELANFEASFAVGGDRPETPIDIYADEGPGRAAPVCTSMLPHPYGYWQGHYFATGLPVPASYMLPSSTHLHCTRGGIQLLDGDRPIGTSAFSHDHWSPNYPREGNTRCGVSSTLDRSLLDASLVRLNRRLVWKARLRLWQSERDRDDYALFERTAVFAD